jgi:hypothetical protein
MTASQRCRRRRSSGSSSISTYLCRLPRLRGELQGMEHRRLRRRAVGPGALRRSVSGGRSSTASIPSRSCRRGARSSERRAMPASSISRKLPALRGRALRHGLPDGRFLQALRRRHRARRRGQVHRLRSLRLGLPLWGARDGPGRRRDEEMHAVRRPIYNETLQEIDRVPSCVRTCPANARHYGDFADPQSNVSIMVSERGGTDLMPEQGTRPVNKYLPPRPRKPLASTIPLAENTDGARGFFAWLDGMLDRI